MPTGDPDAVVIGSGPNGLVAANRLADHGLSVLVLEANASFGGALRSRELTRPGFVHDLGAAFFPFASVSPALLPLTLEEYGLRFCHAAVESAHPAEDGTCASIRRDLEQTDFGSPADSDTWRAIANWHRSSRQSMLDLLLSTLPPTPKATLAFGPQNLVRLADIGLRSARGYAESKFESAAAQRVLPALGLHTDISPDDPGGAAVGFMLGALASSSGFAVPVGGAQAITDALIQRLEARGGRLRSQARVERVLTRSGRATGVSLDDGTEIRAKRLVMADVAAPNLYLRMLDQNDVPSHIAAKMRNFPFGFATFKMDWALDGPVPWLSEDAAEAAVVHTGEDLNDLQHFCEQVRAGQLPDNPYLVVGQQSLCDPSRAPSGKHTLWCYSRVPLSPSGGWKEAAGVYADRIDDRIERLAPGFKSHIIERHITTPIDLEATNANLMNGDLGGGSAQITHQLFMRPVFPYFRYQTSVRDLYLCSSYTHPGAGVHGACGHNAAGVAIQHLR